MNDCGKAASGRSAATAVAASLGVMIPGFNLT
jgi:hypothetical protein